MRFSGRGFFPRQGLVAAVPIVPQFSSSAQFRGTPINGYPNPITITSHPNNQTVSNGTAATFTVVATGVAPITYQWYKNNGTVTAVSGTSPTLIVVSATPADIGNYYVIVRDGFAGTGYESNATSNNGTLTVNP